MIRLGKAVGQTTVTVAVSIGLGALFFAPNADAQRRLPAPIFKAVIRVDGSLRAGIEEAPAVLIRDLNSSRTACDGALKAEQSGGGAEANWAALAQIVQSDDRPASRATIGALSEAESDLGGLQALLSGRWHDRFAKATAVVPTITQVKSSIERLRAAVTGFRIAFERWEGHDCTRGQEAITVTNRRIFLAVEAVNHGMKQMTAALG